MRSQYIFVIGVIFWMFLSTHILAYGRETLSLPDSLLTRDHIYEYTFSDTVKAVRIIELMRERELAPAHVLDIAQGDLLFNNGKYNSALPYYERALHSDSIQNNDEEYMEQLHRMISCYDCLHDSHMKAYYVEELLHKAESCGNKAMRSVALFNMGKMLYYQESKERGYEMMHLAARLMEEADYKYKYDNLRYDYNSLFILQKHDKRFKEALETLERLERVVNASTEKEPEIKGLNDKELKTLYANRAAILEQFGRHEEADEAYRKWKKVAPFYTKDDYLIASYLFGRGKYEEVIRIYSLRENFLRENQDTINYHMKTIKRALGNSYSAIRDYKRAASYYLELAFVTDSLKMREQRSAALELAEVYKTKEQAIQLKEQESDLRLRGVLVLFSSFLLLIAIVFIIRILRYNRLINKKNRSMITTIDELMSYKRELFLRTEENIQLRDELIRLQGSSRERDELEDNISKEEREIDTNALSEDDEKTIDFSIVRLTDKDRVLFDRLTHEIIHRRFYLQEDFTRKDLLREVPVPVNKFSSLFKEFAGCSFTQYIQELRLDHAVHLMRENPTWSLEAIAKESQMSKSAFYYHFQKKYGMKPTEFKEKNL